LCKKEKNQLCPDFFDEPDSRATDDSSAKTAISRISAGFLRKAGADRHCAANFRDAPLSAARG
jgi:hypothetical protein